ncbi:DUF2142 domain-containing protein [Streptomyces sp. ISL-43]|uniref:DUF2142 domain-containing protein n=1 Tax=Streptomyces sp. ISL-43 TaxID=2819183 RepID=UPI001BE874D9|nr:DUF2142 domain-containing protein [Streptomyces sp. ISL-43]MBT2452429.1 DUF2142 domain-containing protein [Streptomyces sp. ISL-43]
MISALTRLADWSARTPKRLWAVSFVLFFTIAASWSAATPLGASPDEHAHFIRAAAVARGQINGTEVMVPHVVGGIPGEFSETGVRLPEWYKELPKHHECYAWHAGTPASCAPALGDSDTIVEVPTAAGRYHPAYYLLTGWPSLLVEGPSGLYLMRLMSALLCSVLLAGAVVTAAEWRRGRSLALLGVFTAATPMLLFMAGMVNPSGGEIAAGILVWTALLSILMSPDPQLLNRRLARVGVGGLVLINIRPLGLIWFAGAVFFGLLLAERGVLRSVLRRKAMWVWTGLLGVATAGALLWASSHPDNSVIKVPWWLTTTEAARKTFGYTEMYVHQMLGYFGWLDTPAPAFTWYVWLAVLAVITVLGLVYGRKREAVALIGMLVAIVVVPVAAQASQAEKIGMVWQGRYLLPFAVGLPLMAVLICASRIPEKGFPTRRLVGFAVAGLALANAAAFFWVLRRFAVGIKGSWLPTGAHWAPPGGWVLWTGVYTVAALALVVPALMRDRVADEPELPDGTHAARTDTGTGTEAGTGTVAEAESGTDTDTDTGRRARVTPVH